MLGGDDTPLLEGAPVNGSIAVGESVIFTLVGISVVPVFEAALVDGPAASGVRVAPMVAGVSVMPELAEAVLEGSMAAELEEVTIAGENEVGSNGAGVSLASALEDAAAVVTAGVAKPWLDEGASEAGVSVISPLEDGAILVQVLPS